MCVPTSEVELDAVFDAEFVPRDLICCVASSKTFRFCEIILHIIDFAQPNDDLSG